MAAIQRIEYKNKVKENSDIEIIDLHYFFETRDTLHLMSDFRLNFWLLVYITEGEGNHYIDFKKYSYKAGDLIIIQKNQVHHFKVHTQAQGYILIINEPFFFDRIGMTSKTLVDFFNRHYKSPILSIDNSIGTPNRTLIDLIYSEYAKYKNSDKEFFIKSLVQSFILSLDDFSQEERNLFHSAEFHTYNIFRSLLEKNYSTKKTVDDYAQLMNVSRKTINCSTRKIVGLSAKEFIIERIILEIKRYLSLGDLLTYEISDLMGFDEPSNMAKFFKRYVGISPSAFKRSLK